MAKKIDAMGHAFEIDDKGNISRVYETIAPSIGDYGRDPLDNGTFRMFPSGDVVSFEESERRLRKP